MDATILPFKGGRVGDGHLAQETVVPSARLASSLSFRSVTTRSPGRKPLRTCTLPCSVRPMRMGCLGDDHTGEGGADLHVIQQLPLHRQGALRHHRILAQPLQPGGHSLHRQAVAVQFRSTDPSLFGQALATGQVQLRLLKRHLRLQQGAPRRLRLRLHQPQRNSEGNLANGANDLNI